MRAMTSAEYEELTKQLVVALVKQVDGLQPKAANSGRRNRVMGASGFEHQIDVSIQTSGELHLIECKYWRRRVSPDAVLTLAGRMQDIAAANPNKAIKGALATTHGPSPGAEAVARYFKISSQRVTSAQEFALNYKNEIHLLDGDAAAVTEHVRPELVTCIPKPNDRGPLW